jgi:hypothetical protein
MGARAFRSCKIGAGLLTGRRSIWRRKMVMRHDERTASVFKYFRRGLTATIVLDAIDPPERRQGSRAASVKLLE